MHVAVMGSWRAKDQAAWKLRESSAEFQEAARRVGKELVRAGHNLIVGSDAEPTDGIRLVVRRGSTVTAWSHCSRGSRGDYVDLGKGPPDEACRHRRIAGRGGEHATGGFNCGS